MPPRSKREDDATKTPKTLLAELVSLRHALHGAPELAHAERATARAIAHFLAAHGSGDLHEGIAGTGLIAAYPGVRPGPTILLRCELDALPLDEAPTGAHASGRAGVSHKCGHDGHMAILAGIGARLARARPRRGRVVLLFQPAEETGEGMAQVLADPAMGPFSPDVAFALHNLPGFPLGRVLVRDGPFAFGSVGLSARLRGRTSHAGYPEGGRSPARALARLLLDLPALPGTLPRERETSGENAGLLTPIHALLGTPTMGTAPGEAVLMATLRAPTSDRLAALDAAARDRIRSEAARDGLESEIEAVEPFPPTYNHPWCAAQVRAAATECGLEVQELDAPFRWSEDFGHLAHRVPAALIGLGAGVEQPQLHHPDYDFPDLLIEPGVCLLHALLARLLDAEPPSEVPCSRPR